MLLKWIIPISLLILILMMIRIPTRLVLLKMMTLSTLKIQSPCLTMLTLTWTILNALLKMTNKTYKIHSPMLTTTLMLILKTLINLPFYLLLQLLLLRLRRLLCLLVLLRVLYTFRGERQARRGVMSQPSAKMSVDTQ
ncbi:hypothetical protein EDC96DRAFT_510044 [Choanephora cucurbitarum]|nr:hypothetical protein EDC96DRAFT_510044 [Choanephora cucurbitarum]